jgi:hypothetical protein
MTEATVSGAGLIHISTFVLLLLSGERNFCVNLNAAFMRRGVKVRSCT